MLLQVYQHGMGGQKLQEPPELPAGAVDPALQDGAAAGAIASASRPARNRRGTSLAAIIAATDGADSDDGDAGDAPASGAATDGKKAGDGAAAGANGKAAADGKTPPPAAAAAGKEGGKPPQQQQRSRGPSQQRGGAGAAAAPAKAPDLVGFMKAGRARKDLTGQAVTGRVDARFDCGYFVSLNIAGQSFSGILYCPTAVAAAAAAGASGQAAGRAAAAVKREDSGAAADGSGGGRKAANGSSVGVKRDAAAAAGGDAGEPAQRGGKRRRGPAPSADPGSASKPKSAKVRWRWLRVVVYFHPVSISAREACIVEVQYVACMVLVWRHVGRCSSGRRSMLECTCCAALCHTHILGHRKPCSPSYSVALLLRHSLLLLLADGLQLLCCRAVAAGQGGAGAQCSAPGD